MLVSRQSAPSNGTFLNILKYILSSFLLQSPVVPQIDRVLQCLDEVHLVQSKEALSTKASTHVCPQDTCKESSPHKILGPCQVLERRHFLKKKLQQSTSFPTSPFPRVMPSTVSCSTSCGFKLFNVLIDFDILRNITINFRKYKFTW